MPLRKGASLILINRREEILLVLRDDDPRIPYPKRWDIPGGHVESGETPRQCILREMQEEMGLGLEGVNFFSRIRFKDRWEYTYWKLLDLDIETIELTEGQRLEWFSREQAAETPLAYGFNQIAADFFRQAPYMRSSGNV